MTKQLPSGGVVKTTIAKVFGRMRSNDLQPVQERYPKDFYEVLEDESAHFGDSPERRWIYEADDIKSPREVIRLLRKLEWCSPPVEQKSGTSEGEAEGASPREECPSEIVERIESRMPEADGEAVCREIVDLLKVLIQRKRFVGDEPLVAPLLPEQLRLTPFEKLNPSEQEKLNRLALDGYFGPAVSGVGQARVDAATVRAANGQRAALCLSGGGIRSATFSLGVLQSLAKHGLLDKFDYLSTVSGGGYIGGWLSSWIHRVGLANVVSELKNNRAEPVRFLRSYSNYLTPRLGILSVDTWSVIAIAVRNLILNGVLILPLVLLTVLAVRLWANAVHSADLVDSAVFAYLSLLLASVGVIGVALARPVGQPDQDSGPSGQRQTSRYFKYCLIPFSVAAFVGTLLRATSGSTPYLSAGRSALVVAALSGFAWLIYSFRYLRRNDAPKASKVAWELAGSLISGAFAGWLLASIATNMFLTPLAGEASLRAVFISVAPAVYLSVLFLQATIFIAVASAKNDDEDREWWARSSAWFLIITAVWLGLSGVAIFGPPLLASFPAILSSLGAGAGLTTLILGKSDKTSPGHDPNSRGWREYLLALAAPMFVVFLFALTSTLISLFLFKGSVSPPRLDGETLSARITEIFNSEFAVAHYETMLPGHVLITVFAVVVVLAVWLAANLLLSVNRFSLHGMYRNRLIRAYLGASRERRRPNWFTGFDPEDNVAMYALRNQQDLTKQRPLHIVNAALNLVGGKNLAWQERKAESFTMSPLHCGNAQLGYRDSRAYGGEAGISLGTSMAISGAAVNSNMGYHTSPAVAFLLTLFNARLGWWLGNPGLPGQNAGRFKLQETYRKDSPRFALRGILSEAFGRTTNDTPYILLSDGGHFENLGLYEMVQRRCRWIVVVDAGQDPGGHYDDLGNAIRKIRVDLGIDISMKTRGILPRLESGDFASPAGAYCALGDIRYSVAQPGCTDGTLLYLKPAIYGCEPADVVNYAKSKTLFPHESTVDQFFSESQFESYRSLGEFVLDTISVDTKAKETAKDMASLFRIASTHA